METFGIIILAAGASTRLGQPKQLLQFNGKSLLAHSVNLAMEVSPLQTIVVLGAHAPLLRKEVAHQPLKVVENINWRNGMASSIHIGLTAILTLNPLITDVIFLACDQPFITTHLLMQLIEKRKETGKGIIGSAYSDTIGIPALFYKKYYDELLGLKGDSGAKKIIKKHRNDVDAVLFPMGCIDIDTVHDYEALTKKTIVLPD